ncbi:MAG: methionine--tRNA ligase subunit beta, partial [Candidatus Hodarchaeota archaeon]
EWLMHENEKFSKSRGIGIWIDEALELAPLDYWRFNLVYNRPESGDTSFLWSEFENNIKTLNDNIGNFIHRTLTFIDKQFNKTIPEKSDYDEVDNIFIEKINNIGYQIGESLINFKLRKALRDIVSFGKEGNVYLNDKAPWHLIKKDKRKAGHVFNICVQAVYALAILLGPFIPDTSEKILSYLNSPRLSEVSWESINSNSVKAETKIHSPQPIFQKLDIEEIKNNLYVIREKKLQGDKRELISYDYFKKLDIRVAKVLSVEKVPEADKLIKIEIDLGSEKRTLVAGLAEHYKPDELIDKKIIVLVNLEPRKLRGIQSEGMLLAAVDNGKVSILIPDKEINIGAKVE